MGEEKDLLSTLLLELRRGTLTISVLSQMNKPKYGYWKKKALPLIPIPFIRCFGVWRVSSF